MDIELDYDASVARAPNGFTTAMQYAANQLDALITNNITVSIQISWDASGDFLGEAGPNVTNYSYAQVVAALRAEADTPAAEAAVAQLPAQDPTNDNGINLAIAQAEALGLPLPQNPPRYAGLAAFSADGTMLNFSTTDFAMPGEYDFVGIAEHELTHALGRVTNGSGPPSYLMDLFRYASAGTLQTDGTNTTYFSIDGGVTPLDTFSTTSDLGDWAPSAVDDSFDAYSNPGVANTISAVDVTLLNVIGFDVHCFTPGTRMRTPAGAVVVERLSIGDIVSTKFRGAQPVKWIGVSHYEGGFIGDNPLLLPVCLQRDALGPGVPGRDLSLSPGHGVCLDGVLVPAWRLVNGATITQAARVERLSYYHIELASHDVLFAEGCEAESYLEDGRRGQFQNADEFYHLYPGERGVVKAALLRLEDGFALRDIQTRVNRRAGIAARPELAGALRGFVDRAGPDRVAGWAQCATQREVPVALDVFVDGELFQRVLANGYRADLREAGLGSGCHAFLAVLPAGAAGRVDVRRALDGVLVPLTEAAMASAA